MITCSDLDIGYNEHEVEEHDGSSFWQDINIYEQDLRKHYDGKLSKEETARLAKLKDEGDSEAREKLVLSVLPWALNLASRYFCTDSQRRQDMVQWANTGVLTAVDKFDYRKGYSLSTYVTCWVRQAVLGFISDDRMVRVPRHHQYKLTNPKKSPKTAEHKRCAEVALQPYVSISGPSGGTAHEDPIEVIGIDDTAMEEMIDADERSTRLSQVNAELSKFTDRDREIVSRRMRDESYRSIGADMNLSYERVRQLYDLCIATIKKNLGVK